MIGLILAVMSLITVMSVMNGFHEELTNRVLNTISHSYITGSDDTIESWDDIQIKINSNDRVIASSPYVEDFALMTSKSATQGVSVRGIIIDQESLTSVLLLFLTTLEGPSPATGSPFLHSTPPTAVVSTLVVAPIVSPKRCKDLVSPSSSGPAPTTITNRKIIV